MVAGDKHSACVAKDGSVYTWGGNSSGQLGQDHVDDVNLPLYGAGVGAIIVTLKCKMLICVFEKIALTPCQVKYLCSE